MSDGLVFLFILLVVGLIIYAAVMNFMNKVEAMGKIETQLRELQN
jgi:hypothetical protein